jgi:plasmid replication initiation protein
MPKKKNIHQLTKIEKAREAKIYQADTLLQKGRFELSLTEQRLILYAIRQIKPTDKKFQEYTVKLKDFYDVCGIKELDSYTVIKKTIHDLQRKFWWITMEDPHAPGTECESSVNWFTVARTNKKSGNFTFMFHPDMIPYLLELSRRQREDGEYYTSYMFQYVLPMKSQYSIRLYELLKSYQKNNMSWWWQIDELKRLLDCRHYARFKDFRVRVLEPAMKEINEFSDIRIKYATEKDGKRIDIITFYMAEKTTPERIEAQKKGLTALDGQIHYWDKPLEGQMRLN